MSYKIEAYNDAGDALVTEIVDIDEQAARKLASNISNELDATVLVSDAATGHMVYQCEKY